MENENSPWVQTGEGSFEPSSELVKRIRENPDQFPNAVEDLSVLSGKTREEVEDILSSNRNPSGALGRGVVRGVGTAIGVLSDNLFGEGTGDTVRAATNVNPGFSTEQSAVESVGEVAGQALPAVAGALATGGALPAAIVGAGLTTLTFEDEDNLANLVDDWKDGAVPDFLVVQDDDDEGTATAKHLATNLIVDLVTAGMGSAIGKVYRVFKEAPKGLAELPAELSRGTEGLSEALPKETVPATTPAAQPTMKIKNSRGETVNAPRTFFRGTNPGDTRRIQTGEAEWDSYLFAADSEDAASFYGKNIETLQASPDAKILYEGTKEWQRVAGKIKGGENLLDYAARAAKAAKEAGYDAAWFQRQGDVGTAIFNPEKFSAPAASTPTAGVSGPAQGLATELKRIADEAGVPLRAEPAPAATAEKAVESVAKEAAETISESPARRSRAVTEAARSKVADDVAAKELGHTTTGAPAPAPVPQAVADQWVENTLNPVKRLLNRSKETNVGRRASLKAFEEGEGAQAYREVSAQALRAAYDNNLPELTAAVRQIDSLKDTVNANRVFKDAVLRSAMEVVDDRFTQIIKIIRDDPTLRTRDAMKMVATDYHKTRVALQEMYRETGSSSAYAFLVRKGVKFDDSLIEPLADAEAEVMKTLKDNGLSIFATEAEFKATRMLDLDAMGFDPLSVLDELDRMFTDFDAMRQGTLDNFSKNSMTRMTKAQREHAQGTFLRWLNDMHSSALLGQPSTALLEAMSNGLNMSVLPLIQHGIWRKAGRSRALREYSGYIAEWNRLWSTFKASYQKGRAVTDDFDILDAQHSKGKGWMNRDYESLSAEGKTFQALTYRLWDFASGLSIGASEGTKALRYAGLAYADGFELALKSGLTRPQAKKSAIEYVASKFNPDGSFKDAALKLDVAQGAWQGAFDTRTVTGNLAQRIDNLRNSTNPVVSVLARSAVPFWRTLINIGSNSMQMIQPIPSSLIKPLARTKWGGKFVGATRFLDDFSGRNGLTAKNRAIGRQRMGGAMMASAWALMEADVIDITGPSKLGRWEAKMAEGQEYPASSLIVNGHAIDLTRFLPYSAPLLLLGVMKDLKREEALRMKDGLYVAEDNSAYNAAATYGTALGLMSFSLLYDAAAMRGVGDLFETISTGLTDKDPRALIQHLEDYGKQFTPGLLRMTGKNAGAVTGDWTQHEGEGFLNEALAAAGWPVGYERLDFLGRPVDSDRFRGVDPTNAKPIRTDDEVVSEYVLLNRAGELGLSLDKPNKVLDAAFWKNLGVQPSFIQWLTKTEAPSLNEMETVDGKNAWDAYRDQVYHTPASADVAVSTGSSGDRINFGKVPILKGETFEAAIRRTVSSPDYEALTPDARVKAWRAIFGQFKKQAKEYLEENLVVSPSLFEGSKYGSPISKPTTLQTVMDAAKDNAIGVQKTRGIPLDDIFGIK